MRRLPMLWALLLCALSFPLSAQDRSYTEGPVMEVTAVKIKDGQFDNYMKHLQTQYKRVMDAQKDAGIILGYTIYSADPRRPEDPDLYLTVVYPNMAAFDGLRDRSEAVSSKVTGQNTAQANTAFADRGKMRQILGSQLIRELKLK
ncbi:MULTISPECIES: hypothetical protein [unclassified Pseudoxanthomonas]|uniref:hypothetical protein n=1 Tax=unclassified Pseudoxanthomonas TaxID=2645906 RepID=UPI0008E9F8DA|nr:MULTISPECIES: hypothetical protein [unclassified Pseudoxanthomonas]SFV26911.1 hypothetical protein SAMN05428990_0511 [Pseudoxanthomonas sp. YR558]